MGRGTGGDYQPMETKPMNKFLMHAGSVALLAASFGMAQAADVAVKLTGDQEVPPVASNATGNGTISIGADKSVSGTIKTTGIVGTAAHIHLAERGKNGPPIITLTKASDSEWTVPAGSKLTDEQYAAFKAGDLYVNVHSAAHAPGEIRTQLK